MGRVFAGGWFLIDLFCAMAIVATGAFVASGIDDSGYSAGFTHCVLFAQASSVQTDADVRGGVADQRRSELVEPHRPRLSLLVATVADGVRLVGGQKSGMVHALFCSVLHRDRHCRAVFHVAAAPAAASLRWIDDLFASGDWAHRQLLLFQSSYNRALFAID